MWKRGDVLKKGKKFGVIHTVRDEGYDIVVGPALLYSEKNWTSDPFLEEWEKVNSLGQNCTDDEIRESIFVV